MSSLPNNLIEGLERGLSRFKSHICTPGVNADGQAWVKSNDTGRLTVHYSTANNNNARIFRVSFRIKSKADNFASYFFDQMDMKSRVSWEPAIKSAHTRLNYDIKSDSESDAKVSYQLVEYTTNAAAGGMVAARWFLDARKFIIEPDGSTCCVTVDAGKAGIYDCEVSHVQAQNYEGSASMLKCIEKSQDGFCTWQCETVAHCALGGYLPNWIVNNETGGAMASTYELLLNKLVVELEDTECISVSSS